MNSLYLFLVLFITTFTCDESVFIDHNTYCTFLEGNSRWYSFYTESPEVVSIITAGNGDGKMFLYKGDCENLGYVTEDDDSGPFLMPQIQLETEANTMYYIHVTDVDLFEICVFTCGPLPVNLISYSLKENGGYITLKWSTGSEINNRMFKVYTSKDAVSWELLGQVPGMGNSSTAIDYTYHDFNKYDGELRYYKLEQYDYNGDYTVLGILPYFSKKEYKTLLKEMTIAGEPLTKDYNGIVVRVYSDKSVKKVIFQ